MKIKTITVEHTRQVTQFNPVRFAITADITEGEDAEVAAKELQRLVLMVTYKDDVKQRDHLINSLVYPGGKPNNIGFAKPQETPNFDSVKKPISINDIKLPSESRSNKAQEADEDDLHF